MKLRYTTIYYYENSFQYGFLFPPYLSVLFAHIGTSIHHHKSYTYAYLQVFQYDKYPNSLGINGYIPRIVIQIDPLHFH